MQQVTAEPQEGQKYKTCKITLVTPSASDAVIKVYPAEHEAEKIWLDNTQDIERWEAITRAMQNYAARGTAVGKPVRYHADSRDLRTISITEEDIPTVTLDGVVIKAPPSKAISAEDLSKISPASADIKKRVESLEGKLNRILDLLQPAPKPEAKEPGFKQEFHAEPEQQLFACTVCGKDDFKTNSALKMHRGRFHKGA